MNPFKLFCASLVAALSLCASSLEIDGAYVREVPPTMSNTAAFMTISNLSDAPVALLGARSDAAKAVELHTHSKIDGMMQMHRVDKIDIAAEGTAVLQPGGFHVMLIGLQRPLKEGDTVTLTLEFSNGEKSTLTAPVRTIAKSMETPMRCGNGKCGSGKCGAK